MYLTKMKFAASLLVVCLALIGSGWLPRQSLAQRPPGVEADGATKPPAVSTQTPALPSLPAQFTRLQQLIRPRADESQIEQIPWIPFLWAARHKAAAEGKPIFIWAAGGPPGSC